MDFDSFLYLLKSFLMRLNIVIFIFFIKSLNINNCIHSYFVGQCDNDTLSLNNDVFSEYLNYKEYMNVK
jgi:hypothetical protein